jgi:hypothetical protein
MGEIVSIHRLFQSKVLLFEREAQILTARQGIAGTTGFIGTRKTAKPSSHPKKPSLADGILGPPGPQPAPH